jgi:hypothetical protein
MSSAEVVTRAVAIDRCTNRAFELMSVRVRGNAAMQLLDLRHHSSSGHVLIQVTDPEGSIQPTP